MKILNFGSINIDYVYAMKEFVKPGETLAAQGLQKHSGGKGFNQSVALAKAGSQVYHAGAIGEDGLFLKAQLEKLGVDTTYIKVVNEPTGHAIIQVDEQGENCIILYGGANQSIDEAFCEEVLADFKKGDVLVLQNEISSLAELIEKATYKGMKIALNPSPINGHLTEDLISKCHWLLVNEVEAQCLTGESCLEACMTSLRKKYPKTAIVMTLGEQGAWYEDEKGQYEQAAYKVKALDTTAAGDTFTGYFLSTICQGKSPKEALEQASKAAALSVTRQGAAPSIPSLEEVQNEL